MWLQMVNRGPKFLCQIFIYLSMLANENIYSTYIVFFSPGLEISSHHASLICIHYTAQAIPLALIILRVHAFVWI
jgi:hypothetical protein